LGSVKTAQKNSAQLLNLINELLDFSKLNNGQMRLKSAAGEFKLFVTNLIQPFEESALEKNIRFNFTSTGVEGYYLFDEEKWQKIISNLLSNALKFTPRDGEISVLLSSRADETIRLDVTDSGPGIPAKFRQKIFDRFYQVDDSAIRNYGGTGIGLSLVKELTLLMNGSIQLESNPGVRTRFSVEIPLQKVSAHSLIATIQPVLAESPKHVKPDDTEAPLLMIVEDNDELRSFLAESMQQYYRVIEAADGLKAWDIILNELPDVIISDVMMPGQDGFDLCRQCKSDNRTAHIGFILLTSKAAHEARLQGLTTGADDYITKPFNQNELELRVINLLHLQQKNREYLQAQVVPAEPQQKEAVITDPFLIQFYKEIDAKIDDAELGVDYLCKFMGMSRSTLNRKLKALLGISTNDVIRQHRLRNATSLMLGGQDITTAAYSVGFSSPSYFSQCFKDQYGVTPSEFLSKQR
jgi:CheY-like chemotaxis protein